ncbi:MAG: hypothetical protein HQL62_05655 [Magnetococcales bacterium]|nr:hypothetical protein [Magnetococcales bacterium]
MTDLLHRATSIRVVLLFILGFILLGWLPWSHTLRASGVVEAERHLAVIVDTPGRLVDVLAPSGRRVAAGAPLFRLENPSLTWDVAMARAQREELEAMQRRAGSGRTADLAPLAKQLASVTANIASLESMIDALTVRARQEGVWVTDTNVMHFGRWIGRGEGSGWIVDTSSFRFTAVAVQEESSALFSEPVEKVEIRLKGQGENILVGGRVRVVPFHHQQLPSAALGWMGGGKIEVAADDRSGLTAVEPFFLIQVALPPNGATALVHGRTGEVRLSLPKKSLLVQWVQEWRAFLQSRYQI